MDHPRTIPMTDLIRRIVDPAELESLLRDGVGYVFSPVSRTVHVAGCGRVGSGASPSEPKIFAADDDSALAYQASRLRDYPNAQPFKPARCCQTAIDARLCEVPPHAAPFVATDEPTTAARAGLTADRPSGKADADLAVSPEGEWCLRDPGAGDAAVELWTTRRLPFTTDQTAGQKEMVGRVASAIRALRTSAPGKRLSGLFTSDDRASRQPDAENITFYNFGDEPFRSIPPTLSFERSYATAPEPPIRLRQLPRYYHRWAIEPARAPWATWAVGEPIAEWTDIDLPATSTDDLGIRAWLAVRTSPAFVNVFASLSGHDAYAVWVTWAVADPGRVRLASAVKGLVDGPVAALQRADDLPDAVIDRMLRRRWPVVMTRERLLGLVRAHEPSTVLPRAPFNRNGLEPCDENCVAGQVDVTRADDGRDTVHGLIVRVAVR